MKCSVCGFSRDKENMLSADVQGHWSFPKRRVLICKECAVKQGWKEDVGQ